MLIGINATFMNESPTGLGVFTIHVLKHLAMLHNDIVIYTPARMDAVPAGFQRIVSRHVRGSLSFFNNLSRFIYINSVLPLRMYRKGVDVLFCPMIEFPFFSRIPAVVHIHDIHPVRFEKEFKRSARHFKLALKQLSRGRKRVTVSTEYVRDEFLEYTSFPEEDVDVVRLAYNSDIFFPRKDSGREGFLRTYGIERPYLLFVGNLFRYKNVESLINAFHSIKDKIDHVLVIAGKREYLESAEEQDERIIYLDYIPGPDLPFLYSYAEMLVHPSLSEGFGLTLLEAMACGTPVVASNRASIPEVAGEAALLVDPLDTEQIADAIMRVISDEELRQTMVERGLRHVRGFSWQSTAAGILRSCEKVCEKHGYSIR